jgi:hypothetical protein
MSVNPNLETLMSLVEDLQDQMPEGKYLEAMNALRDLHRNAPAPRHAPAPHQEPPYQPRDGYVRLSAPEWARYQTMQETRNTWNARRPEPQKLYKDWTGIRSACDEKNVTEREWVTMEYEERIEIIHRALFLTMDAITDQRCKHPNPDPKECTFISRHSVGRWDPPSDPKGTWSCVCGAKNILSKNWEKHEESDKHRKWNEAGRKVSPQRTAEMKKNLGHVSVERVWLGWRMTYYSYHWNQQDINEWTTKHFGKSIPRPDQKWSVKEWSHERRVPTPTPVIHCMHDPLLPENHVLYGKAEYLEIPPRLPHHYRQWRGNNEHIVEMTTQGYAQFLAMAE